MILRLTILGAALTFASFAVAQSHVGPEGMRRMQAAPPPPPGYLCCNMRTDGKWIDDINYADSGQTIVPAGTPVKPIDVIGPHRLLVDISGGQKTLGNQYSRTLSMEEFAKRYIVAEDPSKKLSTYSDRIRAAISSAKVTIGMTREQVAMSIGYPITTENPDPNANVWRYWRSSFSEYRVHFDDDGKVAKVEGDPAALKQVVYE